MQYHLSYSNPLTHLVSIEIKLADVNTEFIELRLPAWRPGRYELQNYAANIKAFAAYNANGESVSWQKTTRNTWKINTASLTELSISYQYYAYQMDAGGCWLDEEQLYLNFICCMMYVEEKINEACTIQLALPANYQIACGLPNTNHTLHASSFYHLADSPMIASDSLLHYEYIAHGVTFHIWIQGKNYISTEKLLSDFKKFTDCQIAMFGDFPESTYHFLFQFLPYHHYHGVEHRNSTVITLGPSIDLVEKRYSDLIGISSHELFHAWNIVKIRPVEMMPYNFSKENYFDSGFVAEGFTTYYGDLFLIRSGVISIEEYLVELNTTLQRHFANEGNNNLSLAESSFDLWVDGYKEVAPHRKVSIYVKGCLVALLLDLEIRQKTNHARSLDDLMRLLWQEYGKKEKGYTTETIVHLASSLAGESLRDFFDECVFGKTDLKERLQKMLKVVGCVLEEKESELWWERQFGFRIGQHQERILVEAIASESPASEALSKHDEVIEMNGKEALEKFINSNNNKLESITLTLRRNNKIKDAFLTRNHNDNYFIQYKILLSKEKSDKWLYNT